MSPIFHRRIFVVMKSHPKRDHRKKRNRKGNKKVQKNCIMKNMNYCVFVDKNKPGSPNSWHVGIIGAEFSQVLSFFYVFGGNPGGGDRSALNPIGSFKAVDNRTEVLGLEIGDENQHFSGKEMRRTGLLCCCNCPARWSLYCLLGFCISQPI